MNFDEFIKARDQQTLNNLQFNAHIQNAKVMESCKWETATDIKQLIDDVLTIMNNVPTDVVTSAGWYFTNDILNKIFEIHMYAQNNDGIKTFIIPEKMMIVFFRNSESLYRNITNFSPYIIEKSCMNIKNIIPVDNGVEFHYNNKVVFKEYDTDVERWLPKEEYTSIFKK